MPRNGTPDICHPTPRGNQHEGGETNNSNPPTALIMRDKVLLAQHHNILSPGNSLLPSPLQRRQILTEYCPNQNRQAHGYRSSCEKEVDADYAAVRVIVGVLKCTGDDSNDDAHSAFLSVWFRSLDAITRTHYSW